MQIQHKVLLYKGVR